MASRKSRSIYILKCFMAVRNCINIFVLCYFKIRLSVLTCYYSISANCVTAGNFNARINPSSYYFSS